jgi:hypothetical protein
MQGAGFARRPSHGMVGGSAGDPPIPFLSDDILYRVTRPSLSYNPRPLQPEKPSASATRLRSVPDNG